MHRFFVEVKAKEMIEAMERRAKERPIREAYEKGYDAGQKEGYKKGYAVGFRKGKRIIGWLRFQRAYNEGYKNAFEKVELHIEEMVLKRLKQMLKKHGLPTKLVQRRALST